MFLLDPNRALPPRCRINDLRQYETGERLYWHHPGGALLGTDTTTFTTGHYSEMHDGKSPRYAWKDVWHQKNHYQPIIENGRSENTCADISCFDHTNWAIDAQPVEQLSQIVERPDVQDMLTLVAERWISEIFGLTQDTLPDMTVFLAELHEVAGLYAIVQDYVRHLILALRSLRTMRKQAKKLMKTRKGSPWAQRRYRDAYEAVRRKTGEFSSDLLGVRFGVEQPIRDITKLIAAMYTYLSHFKMGRRVIHVRETLSFEASAGNLNHYQPGVYGCPGYVPCYDQTPFQEMMRVDKTSVAITACTDFRPQLNGSIVEKLLAILLRQVNMVPTPEVLWELTPLSWLVDYFIHTDKILGKLMFSTKSMAGVEPVIINSSVGLKIIRKTDHIDYCPRLYGHLGGRGRLTTSHYERLAGVHGTDLLDKVRWMRSNLSQNQSQNASAYLLQLLS
jgi:hypothetical protein